MGLLRLLVLATGVAAGAPDYNAQGFAALQKGKLDQAHRLFEKSVREQPNAHFGWLNYARTTFAKNRDKPVDDPCDQDHSWTFVVLGALSRAVELAPAPVLDKLDKGTEDFAFKSDPQYVRWRLAAGTEARSGADLEKLLAGNEWWPYTNDHPAIGAFTFTAAHQLKAVPAAGPTELGTWAVVGGKIEVKTKGGAKTTLELRREKSYFAEGERFVWQLQLAGEAVAGLTPPLVLGPRIGDCGPYNF